MGQCKSKISGDACYGYVNNNPDIDPTIIRIKTRQTFSNLEFIHDFRRGKIVCLL